jgi:hypothetical protein
MARWMRALQPRMAEASVRRCTTGKMVEKQRGASNRRQRIGNPFPGNVGRGAVHWLEQGMPFTQVRRRRQTQPAAPGARNVRQNIAEQVGGDDDIKPFGTGGKLECAGIDQHLIDLEIGVRLCDLQRDGAEQSARFAQHIRFVNDGHLSWRRV